jgi:hypothetical protein
MVCGASVGTQMHTVWVPVDDLKFTEKDVNQYHELTWLMINRDVDNAMFQDTPREQLQIIKSLRPDTLTEGERNQRFAELDKAIRNSAHGKIVDEEYLAKLHVLQVHIKNIWEGSHVYRVCMTIHMVECEILARLYVDGMPRWAPSLQPIHICGLFRRTTATRCQFAQAVGKRFLSQYSVTSQRSKIIEHRRAADWAEKAYRSLQHTIGQQLGQMRQQSLKLDDPKCILYDYTMPNDDEIANLDARRTNLQIMKTITEIQRRSKI